MVQLAKIKDLAQLMRWREEVLKHVFGLQPAAPLLEANRRYYEVHIPDDTHIAYVAMQDGEECGCGGVCYTEELPSPDNPSGKCAYLMNIYVRKNYREQGIAHQIVRQLISDAQTRGCGKIFLETTVEGRSVYTSMGFRDLPDMMKYYDTDY